jgi:AcrR family transcriptional regulator
VYFSRRLNMANSRSELEDIAPLPRGRHSLTPEEVAANQRERILAAIATVIAEHGYGGLTVELVIEVAGVSRSTFYVHFSNKREAVLAAHELIFDRFLAALLAACGTEAEWPMKVRAALGATVDFVTARPRQAQILSTGSLNADAALAERAAAAHDHLASLLTSVRPHSPNAGRLPKRTEQFLIAAIASLLGGSLAKGETSRLRSMQTELVELLLIPYYGGDEAARLAALPA